MISLAKSEAMGCAGVDCEEVTPSNRIGRAPTWAATPWLARSPLTRAFGAGTRSAS